MLEYDKGNLIYEIRYHRFLISDEETDLTLAFSFTSFKVEFNPLTNMQIGTRQ